MFKSIESLCQEFGLEASHSPDELVIELKRRRALIHPDKSDGAFLSDAAELQFSRLSEAVKYLESQNSTQLIITESAELRELKEMVTSLKSTIELSQLDRGANDRTESDLGKIVSKFHKAAQISSGVFAAVCAAILAFSEKLSSNPVLAPIAASSTARFCILVLFFLSGIAYLLTWINEFRLNNLMRYLLSDEGLHAVIFWRVFDGREKEPKTEILKRQIVHDILQMGEPWYSWHKVKALQRLKGLFKIRIPFSFADRVANIQLSKLLERGVIHKSGMRGIDPLYTIDPERAKEIAEDGHNPYGPRFW